MKVVTYETGVTDPPVEVPVSLCESDNMPSSAMRCDILPKDTPCDDGNSDTTNDQCNSRAADAECVGVVAMVSKLRFDIAVDDIALPDAATATPEEIDSSPAAVAIKEALASELRSTFGSDVTIVVVSIAAGSMVVDYRIEVPVAAATQDNKAAAMESLSDGLTVAVSLPAADGTGDVQLPDPIVAPLVTYAYVRQAPTCPVTCSSDCGAPAVLRSDIYRCLVDGAPVQGATACINALGAPPSTRTTCCSAADPEFCKAPMPVLSASFVPNQGGEEPPLPTGGDDGDELPDKTSTGTTVATMASLLATSVLLGAM